jgi:hypothetical protein
MTGKKGDDPREAAVDGPGGQIRLRDQGTNVVPIKPRWKCVVCEDRGCEHCPGVQPRPA